MKTLLIRMIPFYSFLGVALYIVNYRHSAPVRLALLATAIGLAGLTFYTMRPRQEIRRRSEIQTDNMGQ